MNLVISRLREQAGQQPDAPAIETQSQTLSYKDLMIHVFEMANWLQTHRCRTLAFQIDNGINWVVTDLAALAAGINIVPVPGFFSASQTVHALSDSRADIFLTDTQFDPGEHWQTDRFPLLTGLNCHSLTNACPNSFQTTKLTYTSGSTGEPRGVLLPIATIDKVAGSIVSNLAEIDIQRHLCLLPLATLLENIAGLYAPLIRGIPINVPSLDTVGLTGASLDIEKFTAVLNDVMPNSIILVPQLLTALVTLRQFELLKADQFTMIAVGGGRVSKHLLDTARQQNLPVCEGYGLSECCSVLTLNLPGSNRIGSVGKPLAHAEIRISTNGEIEARGATMCGYQGDEKKTMLTDDWYATGDLGYMDEQGFVYITGRARNVFITSFGRNVSPEWVESSLTQHPAVAHALIYGEGQDHNVALIWTRIPQSAADITSIVDSANAELPDYARAHSFILLTGSVDANLVTANGRLKRHFALTQYQSLIDTHYENYATKIGASHHAVL